MFAVLSSLRRVGRLWVCWSSVDSFWGRDDAFRLLTQASNLVAKCQPWFYLRLEACSFFWLSEAAYS